MKKREFDEKKESDVRKQKELKMRVSGKIEKGKTEKVKVKIEMKGK